MKARIMAQGKGRDDKALDNEIEQKRKDMACARAKAKAEEAAKIREQNAAFKAKKESIGAATVNKLSDEEMAMRDAARAKKEAEAAAHQQMLAQHSKSLKEMTSSTEAATGKRCARYVPLGRHEHTLPAVCDIVLSAAHCASHPAAHLQSTSSR